MKEKVRMLEKNTKSQKPEKRHAKRRNTLIFIKEEQMRKHNGFREETRNWKRKHA